MISSFFPGQGGREGGCKQQGADKQATGEQQLGDDAFQNKRQALRLGLRLGFGLGLGLGLGSGLGLGLGYR